MSFNEIDRSKNIRRRLLEIGYAAGKHGAHFGSSLSIVDILVALYSKFIDKPQADRPDPNRNRFILSKGHGALGYFAVLESFDFMPSEVIESFGKNGSNVFCHAHRNLSQGIEYSGGSLGLGFSFGVGVALGNKIRGIEAKVFILVGDGECDEGIVWEAAMASANYKLDNLVLIVDRNNMQSDGVKSGIMDQLRLTDKFTSFGFRSIEVDGHNVAELIHAFETQSHGPIAIIANTIKGKGVSFMEGNADWHYGVLTDQLLADGLKSIEENV